MAADRCALHLSASAPRRAWPRAGAGPERFARPVLRALVALLSGATVLATGATCVADETDDDVGRTALAGADSARGEPLDSSDGSVEPHGSGVGSVAPRDSGLARVEPHDSGVGTAQPRDSGAGSASDSPTVAPRAPAPTDTSRATPAPPPLRGSGIWIDRAEVMRRPTHGAEWEALLADAARSAGRPDISDQHSSHDVHTLAAALVCVRAGLYCDQARDAVVRAIGTEKDARWIAVGRNLGAYVIAADLLDLRADAMVGPEGALVEAWIEGWLDKRLRDNVRRRLRPFGPFHSGANAAAQEGFAYAAVAAYLGDRRALGRAWDAYRRFLCDPSADDREAINLRPPVRDGWTHDAESPCAVNPMGTMKRVPPGVPGSGSMQRIDGALVADMRRGGTFRWVPGYTQYPWVGLEGLVPAAVVLQRAGYPAFDIADQAVLRAVDYLWHLRSATGDERWFDGVRAREIVHLVNVVYGTSFPIRRTIGGGRTVGYTGWTHP